MQSNFFLNKHIWSSDFNMVSDYCNLCYFLSYKLLYFYVEITLHAVPNIHPGNVLVSAKYIQPSKKEWKQAWVGRPKLLARPLGLYNFVPTLHLSIFTLLPCFIFAFPCASVGTTLIHELYIFYSHNEWNLHLCFMKQTLVFFIKFFFVI